MGLLFHSDIADGRYANSEAPVGQRSCGSHPSSRFVSVRSYRRVWGNRLVAYTTANGGSLSASTAVAKNRPASPGLR